LLFKPHVNIAILLLARILHALCEGLLGTFDAVCHPRKNASIVDFGGVLLGRLVFVGFLGFQIVFEHLKLRI